MADVVEKVARFLCCRRWDRCMPEDGCCEVDSTDEETARKLLRQITAREPTKEMLAAMYPCNRSVWLAGFDHPTARPEGAE